MAKPTEITVQWSEPYTLPAAIEPGSKKRIPQGRGLFAWSIKKKQAEYLCYLQSSDQLLARQAELVSGLLGGVYQWKDLDGKGNPVWMPGTPEALDSMDGHCHRLTVMMKDWEMWAKRVGEFLHQVKIRIGEYSRDTGFGIKQIEYILLTHVFRKTERDRAGDLVMNINLRNARNPGEENPILILNKGNVPPLLDAQIEWPA
ncbi:MAG: hypothetical protein GXP25_06470 [Planctomycetes bacterium]|nr:hypothetical protein [Planctomycetota bacterium]